MEFTKDIIFNCNPTVGQDLNITYNGFLANSSELWIVYGFGESWENTTELKMEKSENGFSANVNLLNFDCLNFCFKNAQNEWDNNNYSNFITSINPCPIQEENENKFDIDSFIEELLEPIVFKPIEQAEQIDDSKVIKKYVDLGAEVTNVLSSINDYTDQELIESSSIEEILGGSIIDETPIELFEEEPVEENDVLDTAIIDELISNINNFNTESKETIAENINEISSENETSLIKLDNSFVISPRKLSKFYLFRKRIKLALYKAIIQIPKLILGSEKE